MTLVAVILVTVTPHLSVAQIQQGGTPYSSEHTVQGTVPVETMRPVDVQALKMAHLVDKQQGAGYYNVRWNADGLPSGVYIYRLQAGSFSGTKRVVVLK